MTLKASTGLRDAMLGGASFKTTMTDGLILIYDGTPPATADAAATGTLLCTISDNATGDGLTLGTSSGGTIPKDPSQVWKGVNSNTGTASYFRFVALDDDGTASTTQPRVQGTCGTAGADLNMSSTNLTALADQTIDAANFTLPTF